MTMTAAFAGHPIQRCAALVAFVLAAGGAAAQDSESPGLGPPPVYEQLRETRPEAVGHVRDGRLRIDRFDLELTDGDLYVVPVGDRTPIAIYRGRGRVRAYPPDGIEHQQIAKILDENLLDEEFDRWVFWFTDDLDDRLRALADGTPGREIEKAADLLEDRREALLEHQLINPDSRVLTALWRDDVALPADARPYFYGAIHGRDNDWFSIEIEPREIEEVRVARYHRRQRLTDVWMGTHVLTDFDRSAVEEAFAGFPRDPEVAGPADPDGDDDDDWDFRDFGLPLRPRRPDHEGWTPRVAIPRTDVDLALEGDGDATASVALLIDPLTPLATLRLRISQVVEVTDVRWRPAAPPGAEDVHAVSLLTSPHATETDAVVPVDEPRPLTGEPVHFVQERHDRRTDEDRYEPWVTVLLPRAVSIGERFVLELAYEGELVERLPRSRDLLVKDTTYWIPTHLDNRLRRFDLTFRTSDSYRVASGGALVDERVEDDTRIMRWVTDRPVRGSMSFQYGRFEVDEVTLDDLPPIAVYANRNHRGFAPGARAKTIEDLAGAIRTYTDYFGPYPFDSLLATETPTYGGQAFPGLVLLTFQAFGGMHTDEEAAFRAHEVAHQWWGAGVGWEHYRDQWISEGFAQYAAALYALVGRSDEKQFLEMLDAWRLDALGEVNIGQGVGLKRYGFRPEVIQKSDGHRSGPIVAGYRLQTADTPMDYRLLVYEKGAFILHMIRMMLMDLDTGNDEPFRRLLRDYVRANLNGVATTRSFEAAVTRAAGEPMDWFFDQWVYGTDVPTYRPDLEVSPLVDADAPFVLHGTIRQEDVSEGFRMPVPIRVVFRDRPPQTHRVWVDADEVTVEIPLPAQPTDIDVNYHYAVLARIK